MAERWTYILELWKKNQWLYGVSGFILGLLAFPALQLMRDDAAGFLADFVPEMFGIIFTVLIIDRLYRLQQEAQLKEQLIFQPGDVDTGARYARVHAPAGMAGRAGSETAEKLVLPDKVMGSLSGED